MLNPTEQNGTEQDPKARHYLTLEGGECRWREGSEQWWGGESMISGSDKPTPTRDVLGDQTQVSLHLPGSSRAPPTGHQYKQHRLGCSLPGSLGYSGLKGPAPHQPSCVAPPYFPSLRIHGFSRLHPSQRFLPKQLSVESRAFPLCPRQLILVIHLVLRIARMVLPLVSINIIPQNNPDSWQAPLEMYLLA